jgi:fido (protein-threonine AMPylation protein)
MRRFALSRRENGSQEVRERTVKVGAAHPFRNGKGVVLVFVPILLREAAATKRRIDFCHGRSSSRDIPAIERPKVHVGYM